MHLYAPPDACSSAGDPDCCCIRTEGLAQRRYRNLEGVLVDERARPNSTYQGVLCDKLVTCLKRRLNHLERAPANGHGLSMCP